MRSLAACRLQIGPERVITRRLGSGAFREWELWAARDSNMPPTVLMIAAREGEAREVRFEDGFTDLVAAEPLALASPQDALAHVLFFLRITRRMADVLASAAEIPGIDAADRAAWRHVGPPAAERLGEGYVVKAWLFDEGSLWEGTFDVEPDGAIHPTLTLAARDIGVHIAIL